MGAGPDFADVYLGLGDRPADWSGPSRPDLQFGHLWFIQNLLAYSLLYLLCRQAARLLSRGRDGARPARPVPGHRALILLTLAVAAATYVIRLRHPLDTWVPVLDFLQVEPARVAQYATFSWSSCSTRRPAGACPRSPPGAWCRWSRW
jgi:hypothetical protein